ncbi:MAG: serine/threonine protein kinase [Planctomycetales bacterium]|nr:serine/threonine protein kinase [Planctomycetales bacterium]
MSAPGESVFRRAAQASGLVTAAQLAEATRRVQAVLAKSLAERTQAAGTQAAAASSSANATSSAKAVSDVEAIDVTDRQLATALVQCGVLNRWQAQQLLAGRTRFRLGVYDVIDSIGQGGMGQVFKARHSIMGRTVAIKVLPRDRSTPEAIERFMREIRAQASLDHANLVRALDAGHEGNVHFLVTEYVPGTDLRHLIRRTGRLSMSAAATIISQAAAGLQHAHDKGFLHRDVKPGNLLVSPDGTTKISDLGLVGTFGETNEFDPLAGKIVGTADYLSPEQIRDPRNIGPPSDVYSVGCTLYYAVTAKVPFPGGTTRDKARAHCEQGPIDPRLLNRELSDEFVDLIAAMMVKDARKRVQSAAEVIERLRPWTSPHLDLPPSAWQDSGVIADAPQAGLPNATQGAVSNSHDTQPSFLGDAMPHSGDSPSQGSQGTQPIASAGEDTLPMVRVEPPLMEWQRRASRYSRKRIGAALAVAGVTAALLTAAWFALH